MRLCERGEEKERGRERERDSGREGEGGREMKTEGERGRKGEGGQDRGRKREGERVREGGRERAEGERVWGWWGIHHSQGTLGEEPRHLCSLEHLILGQGPRTTVSMHN